MGYIPRKAPSRATVATAAPLPNCGRIGFAARHGPLRGGRGTVPWAMHWPGTLAADLR